MREKHDISDDDICLYLDGEADQALSHAIDELITADDAFSQRVEALRRAGLSFAAAADQLLDLAPAVPGLPEVRATSKGPWAAGLVGLAAGIVLTFMATWTLPKDDTAPNWRQVVANYHSLYVTETLSEVETAKAVSDAQLQRLSSVLDLDLTNLPEVDGLTFRRAQQLGFNGKPIAQLTFLTAQGGPVALCIIKTSKSDSDAILFETLDGLSAYSWVEDGYGVLLIGPPEAEDLPDAAEEFKQAIGATAA